jgi:hypothetical protein
MPADRHAANPKTVRMPGGLLAWYEQHAEATGQPVNAVLVKALQEYRERTEGESLAAKDASGVA